MKPHMATPQLSSQARADFHLLAKPTGAICNLDCKYCFFLSKEMLYPGSRFRMADDLLETYIRQLIESQPGPGGHRRLAGRRADADGPRLLRALDRAASQRYRRPGQQVSYTIQTNGTLLDDEWCGVLQARTTFLVGLSIDGPRELHDAYRVDKGGQGTFDEVMRGWRVLNRARRRRQHPVHGARGQRRSPARGLPLLPRRARRRSSSSSSRSSSA